jgi:hypothetical protein
MTSTIVIDASGIDRISGPADVGERGHHDPRLPGRVEPVPDPDQVRPPDRHAAGAPAPGDVTGRYLLQDNYPIDITAADERLTLTAAGQPSAVLLPLRSGHYRHPGLDLEIRFHRTADRPRTLELRQEGIAQTATRSVGPPTELP